jgi:hypothetical protein
MKYENKLDIVRKFRMTPVFQNWVTGTISGDKEKHKKLGFVWGR